MHFSTSSRKLAPGRARPPDRNGDTIIATPKTADPIGTAAEQLNDLWEASRVWFEQHYLQILIGIGVGTLIVLILHTLRGLGARLCRDRADTSWAAIFGRAIDKTGTMFMIVVAAKLVDGYAQPPAAVQQTINFLFIVFATIHQLHDLAAFGSVAEALAFTASTPVRTHAPVLVERDGQFHVHLPENTSDTWAVPEHMTRVRGN